jgi:hypothetical protein
MSGFKVSFGQLRRELADLEWSIRWSRFAWVYFKKCSRLEFWRRKIQKFQ